MKANTNIRPPLPPFSLETATQKVRMAEDAWNMRDPERVSLAYTVDSVWRNRVEFLSGREAIVEFLRRKWAKELDYRLIKELWTFQESRIAVRFAYEWHDDAANWFRSYGNENWEFDESGFDIMLGEDLRLSLHDLGRMGFERNSNLRVQLLSSAAQHAAVSCILNQHMLEAVDRIGRRTSLEN